MIKGFEDQTEELNEYELNILVPVLVNGLLTKVGKENAITNKKIVTALTPAYKINDARVRKIINHIRRNKLVRNLIATSAGYYISSDKIEIENYIISLKQRADAIVELANSYT